MHEKRVPIKFSPCNHSFYLSTDLHENQLLVNHLKEGIILGSLIGHGTYGLVYRCVYKRKICAIKIVFSENIDEDIDELLLYEKFNAIIGPSVYDIFYLTDECNKHIIFIILELFDYDLEYALKNRIVDEVLLIRECIRIINSMVFDYDIFCIDIKPQNFIFKRPLNVKLTDFGGNFCASLSEDFTREISADLIARNAFIAIMKLQLFIFCAAIEGLRHKDLFTMLYSDVLKTIPWKQILDAPELYTFKHYVKFYGLNTNAIIHLINNKKLLYEYIMTSIFVR